MLLLSAWLPVVLGLAHLCLQKTDSPISLVQALVGILFFPFVQPVLYIRLLLLHQVLLLHNFTFTLHMVQKSQDGGKYHQDTEAEMMKMILTMLMKITRTQKQKVVWKELTKGVMMINIYDDNAECVCLSVCLLPVVFTSKNMSVRHEN